MLNYDDAVFVQKCKAVAKEGRISLDQVTECLVETCGDLLNHLSEKDFKRAKKYIRQEYAMAFTWQVRNAGLIIDYASN
jgi:hypothetical protein